ncbi:dolichyl-phosphate-mannose--protein mannosyltransferase [Corynebacterium epidermidicanis]|uniref:Polyprenol-phosphate-mannose--protein mannosyltransferase n=1 Tax=Corynebacterium epidermidicanis TaxID=1050174 RepID=A0A0G3GT38_9CORY|nr:phospholipid carrier-dependent glycosyltransferase [Corynebacterium epidermidicanis]AKK02688.1 Dolichyl-phosphate-mannose-protein mannosyltransferase [Corynebacterium epidermidicanis]
MLPGGSHTINIAEPSRVVWTAVDWAVTLTVAVFAFVTRFVGLTSATDKGTPVFDEKHYVPQAWDMVESLIDPVTGGIESNPAYGLVVHPPLAKQLLAMGEMVFGYTPLGWRVMTALFSTLTVVVILLIARRLSNSTAVAAFAGTLALFDGVLLVAGRFGMLDIFLVLFVVLAAYFIVLDHDQMRRRMYRAYLDDLIYQTPLGPRFGFRWWRFAAGICLGLALSVKWSGLYYIAFFGVLCVCLDWGLRHAYRIQQPFLGTLLRDCLPAFASLVIVPILLYVWSWRAWFASETSVYRHAKVNGTIKEDSLLQMLPDSLAGWFYYHDSVLKFHASLTSSSGHSHPWDSKPWSWLVAARPVLYYSQTNLSCDGTDTCRRMIYLFGTPVIWWLTVPVVLWALWRVFIGHDRRYIVPLVAFAAGFIPWIMAYDRQMYFFYAIPLVPFTIVMIALTLGHIANYQKTWRVPGLGRELPIGQTLVFCYLGLVFLAFVYWSPILYGTQITEQHYENIMWLRSWK